MHNDSDLNKHREENSF